MLPETSNTDVAWAAGLFEGEGCFTASWQKKMRRYYLAASITMTDEDVILRFHRIVGIGKVHKRPAEPHKKAAWRWQATGETKFRALFGLFEPYLGERRRARALELLNNLGRINGDQLRF